MLVLNNVNKLRMTLFGERETLHLRKAVEYAAALPMTREKDLKRALQQMPADLILALANPVVRQFSTSDFDERPPQGAVTRALDILAQSAVVGIRREPELFSHDLGQLFNLDPINLPIAPRSPKAIKLAEIFRSWGFLGVILEKDLELYQPGRGGTPESPRLERTTRDRIFIMKLSSCPKPNVDVNHRHIDAR